MRRGGERALVRDEGEFTRRRGGREEARRGDAEGEGPEEWDRFLCDLWFKKILRKISHEDTKFRKNIMTTENTENTESSDPISLFFLHVLCG
jgi:hypothetical protein